MSKQQFQTEVSQLLDLIVHALYSHKEIFLRELISNASDAIDKLRYLALTNEKMKKIEFEPRIDIKFDDKKMKTLTISDTGIGMDEKDLSSDLGTIARSGTKTFLSKMTGDAKKDSSLIGQFGVGFYSVFMVTDKVEVISKKAGQKNAYKWISDGKSGFEIQETERDDYGTTVILHLNDEGKEYASRWKIEEIIKKYSNHIAFPIYLHYEEEEPVDKDSKKTKTVKKEDQINTVTALWKQSKSQLKEKDYNEFYKTIAHDMDDPLMYIHTHAEGKLEYSTLFYIPKKAPFDLYHLNYLPGVKLYIQRVFITSDEKELLPTYLRFVKGIIDSEDLPLNVSRETLQHNKIMENIRAASVKKLLSEFKKLADKDKDKYSQFYNEFGRALKEGLYHDFTNRDILLELIRFKSTKSDEPISLAEYKKNMKKDQKVIYYISGGNAEGLKNSPLLEAYKNNDIEVLLMVDEIDEIVIPSIGRYNDIELKSVNISDSADDLDKEEKDKKTSKANEDLTFRIKEVLKDEVKDVKISKRLSDSPSCIVTDKNDPTIQMQNMMRSMGQANMPAVKPILEINPDHKIIKKLKKVEEKKLFEDISLLLLDQAVLIGGGEIKNPSTFIKTLNKVMEKAL